jgi:hypothetical protein
LYLPFFYFPKLQEGKIAMAILLKGDITGKRCWTCGKSLDHDEVAIVSIGARDVLYMHPACAQSLSQQLLRDLSQLDDLGFVIEEDNWISE